MSAYTVANDRRVYRPGLDVAQPVLVVLAWAACVVLRLRRVGVARRKPFDLAGGWYALTAERVSPLSWWSRRASPVGRHRRPGVWAGRL